MTSRPLILLLVAIPIAVGAEPAKKLWSCDTVKKMSTCFEVEDAELARTSDTKEFLQAICDFGGGKLATTACRSADAAGTCLKTKALANSFYAKGAPDHYTFAGHYYSSGGHPSDADDEQRCTSSDGVWQKGYVALKSAATSAKK